MKKIIIISIGILFIINTIVLVSADNEEITGTFNPFAPGENVAPSINWVYPLNGEASEEVTLINISAGITDDNEDTLDIYFFTNKTTSWTNSWNAIGSNLSVGNGTYMCNQTFNSSERFNTRWRWKATTYYWSINVSDGTTWTNNTYYFTTEPSRYDVDDDESVFVGDLNIVWANRNKAYLGLYDTDADSTIFVGDLNAIWANK